MAAGRGLKVALGAASVGVLMVVGLVGIGRRTPELAPDFAVTDLRGQAVRLSAFRGKVVFLNLWATWCEPCRQEMPAMQRLYERLRDRDFQLLAVSQDEEGKRAVEPFVHDNRITFPVLLDPDHQVGDRYGITGYPETFLIDRNGKVIEHVIGPRDWMAPEWTARLDALIAASDVDAARAPAPHAPS